MSDETTAVTGISAEIRVKSSKVAEDDGHVVVAIGDEALPCVQPIDDGLREDVAEEILRSGSLSVEVVHHPVEESGVRVPHRFGGREDVLELMDAASEPGDLPNQVALARCLGHVPRRTATKVSLRKRLEVAPPIGPISPAQ